MKTAEVSKPESNQETEVYFWRVTLGDGRLLQLGSHVTQFTKNWCETHQFASEAECPACDAGRPLFEVLGPVTGSYLEFLASKRPAAQPCGMAEAPPLNAKLFPFQRDSVRWALRQGRAAFFFDCGLGKTAMQLEWAKHVARHTGKPVLILAPLAVSQQTQREGAKFDVPVNIAKSAADVQPGVNVTNYERLGKFDPSVFGGVVLDESSILKSYMGKTKRALMEAFRSTPFRLCCTATPAPNDHMELGNHADFLGIMASSEMLTRWFINDTSAFGTYVLKGHAVGPFWDWVASWARCAEHPSDLGYEDGDFRLPGLELVKEVVAVDVFEGRTNGELFRSPSMNATGVHKEKRRTADQRAQRVAELVAAEPEEAWLIWTDTDYEADALTELIPGAVEVRGSHKLELKEERLLGFGDGAFKVLVSKPKLAGLGLNFQNCARVAFVGPSYSYEAFYQAVRRTWRFGQKRPVRAHLVMASTELHIWDVVSRKAGDHDSMKREMRLAMRRAHAKESPVVPYLPTHKATLPAWLQSA